MPGQHAVLSPSSSDRWISCPASVRLAEKIPPGPSSVYAEEGTKAHALGELKASLRFGKITQRQFDARRKKWEQMDPALDAEALLDMERHTDDYVALIEERMALYPGSIVLFEERMDSGVPRCWGTSDTVIVSPTHVEIIDLKYGAGVPVSAVQNPQLRLYGLGALDTFGDLLGDTQVVRMTIFQPRIHGGLSTEEMAAADLRAWRQVVIPIAESALKPGAKFGPSEKACRWCPAAGDCRARKEYMTKIDFGSKPDLLTPAELAEMVRLLPDVKNWAAAIEETALRRAYSEGVTLPGFKVVLSGGSRKILDKEAAIEKFVAAGYDRDQVVATALKGLGDLEKILAARARAEGVKPAPTLESVLGNLIEKGQGKPALAHQDDSRPDVNPNTEAKKEFSREE